MNTYEHGKITLLKSVNFVFLFPLEKIMFQHVFSFVKKPIFSEKNEHVTFDCISHSNSIEFFFPSPVKMYNCLLITC